MKQYDIEKARQIVLKNKKQLVRASLGMHEDWYWTANTIWQNGMFTKILTDDMDIAGINGSAWATPTLQLIFKDGTDKMIEVSKGQNTCKKEDFLVLTGVLSQPVQDNITPLSED
jgi:hypothetical protein